MGNVSHWESCSSTTERWVMYCEMYSHQIKSGNSMGMVVKFGINTTSVALKMGKISQGEAK